MKIPTRSILCILVVFIIYLTLLRFPEPLFPFSIHYRNLILYSDNFLPDSASQRVLNLAYTKLTRSPIFDSTKTYRVFVCNASWRRLIFFQNPNRAGGESLNVLPTTLLGPANIEDNLLLKSDGQTVPAIRSMDYFIAHEITHQATQDYLGAWKFYRLQEWIREGYADYVGKGGNFDVKIQIPALRNPPERQDVWRTEYDAFNAAVSYLLDYKKITLSDLLNSKIDYETIKSELLNVKDFQ